MPDKPSAPPAPTGGAASPPPQVQRAKPASPEKTKEVGSVTVPIIAQVTMPKELLEQAMNDREFIEAAARGMCKARFINPDQISFGNKAWEGFVPTVVNGLALQLALIDYAGQTEQGE